MYQKIDSQKTQQLYWNYRQHLSKERIKHNGSLVKEVAQRLQQLSLLMEIISALTVREMNSKTSLIPSIELWMYVECFYYLAFRTRRVIKSLPKLSSFESPGIRDVRNHLLEHPEGLKSDLLKRSFSWGKGGGPVLKAQRHAENALVFPDAGLYANYLEFQENLNNLLASKSL